MNLIFGNFLCLLSKSFRLFILEIFIINFDHVNKYLNFIRLWNRINHKYGKCICFWGENAYGLSYCIPAHKMHSNGFGYSKILNTHTLPYCFLLGKETIDFVNEEIPFNF